MSKVYVPAGKLNCKHLQSKCHQNIWNVNIINSHNFCTHKHAHLHTHCTWGREQTIFFSVYCTLKLLSAYSNPGAKIWIPLVKFCQEVHCPFFPVVSASESVGWIWSVHFLSVLLVYDMTRPNNYFKKTDLSLSISQSQFTVIPFRKANHRRLVYSRMVSSYRLMQGHRHFTIVCDLCMNGCITSMMRLDTCM